MREMITALLAASTVAACGGGESTGPSVERVEITPAHTLLVGLGDTTTFEVRLVDAGGGTLTGPAVSWIPLDPGIVDVDGGGLATAVGPGVGRLVASADGVEATARVEVWIPPEPAEYEPGESYLGREGYVEYLPGRLPVVISAPHGGALEPIEIPDRTFGTLVTDTNTRQTLLAVRGAFLARTGRAPHVVISHLRRTKLDPNREIVEAAQGDPFAENAWEEFHGFIERATDRVEADFGAGLYLDLHGHGHDIPRVEIGLLISSNNLGRDDASLEALVGLSSVRSLARRVEIGFAELIRGAASLGALLANRGYRSVPSPADPDPGGEPYFSGGYNTGRHGSRDGGDVDGMQLELHYPGLRDTGLNRQAFGTALAEAVEFYMLQHYGFFSAPSARAGAEASRSMASAWAAPLH